MSRSSWDTYFMNIAKQVATRATCPRASVGVVLVQDKNIIATGYNGSIGGLPHCTEIGCMMIDNHCKRTIHAECNAILQAAKHGVSTLGAVAYITHSPCWDCYKALCNAGIDKIIVDAVYNQKDWDIINTEASRCQDLVGPPEVTILLGE